MGSGSDGGAKRSLSEKLLGPDRNAAAQSTTTATTTTTTTLADWTPNIIAGLMAIGTVHLWTVYLRRIPGSTHIQPSFFRKRSLFGRVTSVGDGDNFHMFHTPGGRWAGWGWLRKVPSTRADLKGKTIPIRLAGIDAPEGAHFGRPAQPHSAEALAWLTQYLLHRPVRAYIWKRDQYERIVATVYVRRWLVFRRDVSYEMLARGLATTYEAKTGAEYGGLEEKYRIAEVKARVRRLGMWSGKPEFFESPRAYKAKWAAADKEKEAEAKKT